MFKDLLLIILGAGVSSAYFYFQDYRRKQKEKKQERLNDIKIKTNWRIPRTTQEDII